MPYDFEKPAISYFLDKSWFHINTVYFSENFKRSRFSTMSFQTNENLIENRKINYSIHYSSSIKNIILNQLYKANLELKFGLENQNLGTSIGENLLRGIDGTIHQNYIITIRGKNILKLSH